MRRMHPFVTPLLLLATACGGGSEPRALAYVGAAACGECHAGAVELVAGRAHERAMQPATPATVSARFDGARLAHYGETAEFLRRGDSLRVRTVGADGAPAEFAVSHVMGIRPLEQYLVRFPGGRLQVLPFAWDTRPASAGGGRWFHMRPGEAVPSGDELHWTGPLQTWNYMCAECHLTGPQRGYDLAADAYATTWRELGVQCEACHGPGSGHVAWARAAARDSASANAAYGPALGFPVDLGTKPGGWAFPAGAPIARRTQPLGWNAQVETCGACHARRETLVEAWVPGRPLLATHRPVLLEEGLYYPDGQMEDEVYEYGSFLQSRMYRAGVTCSDCHHASTQEVPPGNTVCAKCHQPTVYDSPAHHFHESGSSGASCVACHMASRTYMVVDPRHDHSIRVPRPDLSSRIGSPNACTACHTDRSAAWAARAAERWYGSPNPARHYGDVLHAARRGGPGADTALIRLAADTGEAAIVRATAVSLLGRYLTAATAAAIERAAGDPEPLVRLASALAGAGLPADARRRATSSLLTDSLLAIRVEAARINGDIPDPVLTPAQRAAFEDFVRAQRVNADQPESHLRLGVFHLQRGEQPEAELAYRDAIRIRPRYAGGYLNLADLYRLQGRDGEGERVLREGMRTVHRPGVLHHSLGLLLVRRRALDEAITELARAAQLEPDMPRFAHVYGVALHSVGRTAEALRVLGGATRRWPHDPELADALASIRTQ